MMPSFYDWLEAQQARNDHIGAAARVTFGGSGTAYFVALLGDPQFMSSIRAARHEWLTTDMRAVA